MASVIVAGDVSGTCTLQAPSAAGSTVLTLPVIAADTLAGIAATQTLTNKTLVAPALGTPASGVLTNCTGVVAAALPAGSVLQVVQGSTSTQVTNATSTFADTGLTATITPKFSTSKILVATNQNGVGKAGATVATGVGVQLLRGASVIQLIEVIAAYNNSTTESFIGSVSFQYLDSPATTSATTYKIQFKNNVNAGTVYVQVSGAASSITLMEIAV